MNKQQAIEILNNTAVSWELFEIMAEGKAARAAYLARDILTNNQRPEMVKYNAEHGIDCEAFWVNGVVEPANGGLIKTSDLICWAQGIQKAAAILAARQPASVEVAAEPVIGRGFRAVRIETDAQGVAVAIHETPFWLHPVTAKLYRGEEGRPSYSFGKIGGMWVEVEALPMGCEYIGNYWTPEGA